MSKPGRWMVWNDEEGLVCIADYDKALREYEAEVERVKDYVRGEGEFSMDLSEHVVLARVERDIHPIEGEHGAYDWKENMDEFSQGEEQ